MGQCPICKKKYHQGVEYCPNCQVGLIPGFNKVIKEKEREKTFIEIYRTENTAIAGLIKEVLEDHDILCYLDNYFSHSLNVHLFFPLAYHGIRVMVYEEDAEEAREILGLFFVEN
jgi:hypothetical protein